MPPVTSFFILLSTLLIAQPVYSEMRVNCSRRSVTIEKLPIQLTPIVGNEVDGVVVEAPTKNNRTEYYLNKVLFCIPALSFNSCGFVHTELSLFIFGNKNALTNRQLEKIRAWENKHLARAQKKSGYLLTSIADGVEASDGFLKFKSDKCTTDCGDFFEDDLYSDANDKSKAKDRRTPGETSVHLLEDEKP